MDWSCAPALSIRDDYAKLRYLRVKRDLVLPVPDFAKAFACALQQDANPLFFSNLVISDDDDEEMASAGNMKQQQQQPLYYQLHQHRFVNQEPLSVQREHHRCLIAYLTPRMAAKLFWHGFSLCRHMDAEGPSLCVTYLPQMARVHANDGQWWDALVQCLKRIVSRLARGRTPDANCNGEVIAMYILLEFAKSAEVSGQDADVQRKLTHLPSHSLDSDFDLVKDMALSEHDIFLMYYTQGKNHMETGFARGTSSGASSSSSFCRSWDSPAISCSSGDLGGDSCSSGADVGQLPRSRAYLHPREWFRAFDMERIDDHL